VSAESKPKRGRPSKGLSETTVLLRLPEALRLATTARAESEGVSTSEWWRDAAQVRLSLSAEEVARIHALNATPPAPVRHRKIAKRAQSD